ncbi:hypothetical protein [Spongiimicrobium sp. 3-5]|uniref:hypothetical protein n=1 Tax=Spongiimicrobium sp. 3-5 TaxID=3332596 RepID=UPI00397F4F90
MKTYLLPTYLLFATCYLCSCTASRYGQKIVEPTLNNTLSAYDTINEAVFNDAILNIVSSK